MEVAKRFVGTGLVATLLIASSYAQIIVQPGYTQPSYQYNSFTPTPVHQSPVKYQQSTLSLAEEFERNQILQRIIENQIIQMVQERQAQQMQQIPGTVGLPLFHMPLRPRFGGGRLYSWTPNAIRGLHAGGYGITRPPLLLREAAEPRIQGHYPGRTQWPRSVLGGPGDDADDGSQVHDVASESTVEGDSVNGVDGLPVPQALVPDDAPDKLLEPRHTGPSDDEIVGSPLDRIHYNQPRDTEQHHLTGASGIASQFAKSAHAIGKMIDTVAPGLTNSQQGYDGKDSMVGSPLSKTHYDQLRDRSQQLPTDFSGMASQFAKSAQAIGNMIDTVAPDLMNSRSGNENKDPISSMTRQQDPARNYQQQSQPGSNYQPMTGQTWNNQQPWQNPGWGPQSPYGKSSGYHQRYSQQESPTYPALNSATNSWLTAAKQIYNGQPHQRPGYNTYDTGYNNNPQPDYQSYQSGPLSGGYRPYTAGITGSSANSYNYYNPSQRSSYYNPYAGYSYSGAADQYGRAILNQLPSFISSFISNPSNMNYFGNMLSRPYGY